MATVNNTGAAFEFQHAGRFYTMAVGANDLPDDTAEYIVRKKASSTLTLRHQNPDVSKVSSEIRPGGFQPTVALGDGTALVTFGREGRADIIWGQGKVEIIWGQATVKG